MSDESEYNKIYKKLKRKKIPSHKKMSDKKLLVKLRILLLFQQNMTVKYIQLEVIGGSL